MKLNEPGEKRMKRITLCTLLLTLAWTGFPIMAMTPDGETPAVEDVCDDLIGGTPGLYGLCVAYCEAQDCDSEAAHSGQCTRTPPSEPVLRNYNRKMRDGDPAMPCLAPPPSPCPCWTEAELANIDFSSCKFEYYSSENGDSVLSAEGTWGEMASIYIRESSFCVLENTDGIGDRQSMLDDLQLEACSDLLEQAELSINCSD
jgi:hypothetical protein